MRPPSLHNTGLGQYQPPSHTTTSPSAMMAATMPLQSTQMMGSTNRVEDLTTHQQQQQTMHDMTTRQGVPSLHHQDGIDEDGSETGELLSVMIDYKMHFVGAQ